ncbi:MAG: BamA/TamA family outer membrane protein [Bacteroidales bacterium]|nr:BamA/TamA family outer membrane protein [Bacteroidales bacterium]MCF8344552.1 BamA/TamA family outer membrane protein [Bacteroidales bacterium]MCF8352245.1 BamA/TamA family outer membrane protein [Bacteroidales bacterium]MCF8374768.1 BamA/TamA family outer membrane protein [Bacteroidales bacterium]MCF8399828.1 BamA/TamA family outer membrane protein [Bacteroidales bacterium]
MRLKRKDYKGTSAKVLFVFTFLLASILYVLPGHAQVQLGDELIELDYSNPGEYEIGGITVSGVKYLDQSVLVMLSGLSIGDKIQVPGDDISDAIRSLWKQGLFESIKISVIGRQENVIFLNIDLQERPRLSKFSFKGIRKAEAESIKDDIRLTSGDVVTDNLIINTRNIIKKHYKNKGFLDAEVKIIQVPDTSMPNAVRLVIDVDKNKKVKIYQINVYGNEQISDAKIKSAFKNTKEKSLFRPLSDIETLVWDMSLAAVQIQFTDVFKIMGQYASDHLRLRIFKSSKYIEDDFEEDKATLIDRYNKLGYRDAQVVKDSIYRNTDNTINLDVYIDEGDKYYFRNITWVGNTKYTDEQLGRILKIEKGDIYNRELLQTNLSFNPNGTDVSSLYLDDGYLFFTATPVEVQVENDSIDIEIRIREGKQARINRVTVSGNTRTNDHVIMREVRTRPGQLFSRTDLIRTQRELAQLRYFDPESINPGVNPDPESSTVDIEYQVEETSSDQIELSGGWGYGRVIGTLGLSFNNFSLKNIFNKKAWRPVPVGDGQKLTLRMQTYGIGYFSYSFSFTEPWLGGRKPNNFSVSYYHSLFSNGRPRGDTNRSEFKIDGLSFGLGKRLEWPDDFFLLQQGISLQMYRLKNYGQIFSFGSGTGTFNNFNYKVTLGRNSLSQYIYPRYGSEVSVSLELTPPYSLFSDKDYSKMSETEKYKWIEYHKWKFKANWYTEIAPKLVLSARTQFGFLGLYNREIGITPFERFYLGGDGLSGYNNLDGREIIGMRGYANESITPNYYLNQNLGGTIYGKYTLELRYPFSLNPNATIYATTFLEAGNAWIDFDQFDPFDVRRTAGFGLRVFLPMFGLLGIDYGYGFDEIPGLPDANGGQWHFSINQSIE